jgi:predicted amidohydrolase
MKNLRVAAVQMESKPLDKAANLDRIEYLAARAAREGAKLISFPECCITGYMPLAKLSRVELLGIAESVPKGPSTKRLLEMARQYQIAVAAGLIEREGAGKMDKCYVVAMPNGKTAKFHKFHPFVHPALTPGDKFVTFDYLGWRFGILICYDNNQPENGRVLATKGVQVLLAPHQTGGFPIKFAGMGLIDRRLWERRKQAPEALRAEFQGPKGREWLMRWLPSRAYDNGCYLLFSNGVGTDGDEIRTGNAMILDPHGRVIAESREIRDHLVVAELLPSALSHNLGSLHRQTRRPELYTALTQRVARRKSTKSGRDAAIADKQP